MASYDASQWSDLFVAGAGAAAALTGLVFVAVSINIDAILGLPGVPERALQTLVLLMGVLVVSMLGLAPGQSRTALGLELSAQAVLWTAVIAALAARSLPRHGPPSWLAARLGVAAVGTLPFLAGGATLLAGSGGGLYWTLGGIVGAFVGAVLNAWVLLVEIRR